VSVGANGIRSMDRAFRKRDSRTSTVSAKPSASSSKSSAPSMVSLLNYNFKHSKSGVTKDQWRVLWKAARKRSPWLKLLRPHQRNGVRAGSCIDGFAALYAQRSGKTWVTGAILDVEKDVTHDALLVGPLTNLKSTWAKFLNEKLPWYSVHLSLETYLEQKKYDETRHKAFGTPIGNRILLLNYEAVDSQIKSLLKIKWDRTIYDEAQRLKNRTSIASKNAWKLGRISKRRIALTGTPMDLDEKDLWAIMRFVDVSVFGSSFPTWNKEYVQPVNIDMSKKKGMVARNRAILQKRIAEKKAPLHKKGKKRFIKKIAPHAMRISEEDAGLIKPNIHVVPVKLHKKERRVYDELEKNMVVKHKGVVVKTPLKIVQMGKLQQITGGYLKDEDGEVHRIGKGKRVALAEVLEEHIEDEPFVIFCKFVWEVHAIADLLSELGWPKRSVARLWGKVKDLKKDPVRTQMLLDFQAGKYDVIVCQQRTGGVGVDLYRARKAFVYSLGHSYIDYSQMVARLGFLDKKTADDFFLLLAENTIDTDIYTGVTRKQSITNIFYDRLNNRANR